jgi:hypothetical protein
VGTLLVRPPDMVSSEISGSHLCNYSLLGCNVAHVCRMGRTELRVIILPVISEVQELLVFNFEHRAP